MGQGQSQINGKGQTLGEARPGTAESENQMDPEERAKLQAEVNLSFSVDAFLEVY
jgi:hypothetical protein